MSKISGDKETGDRDRERSVDALESVLDGVLEEDSGEPEENEALQELIGEDEVSALLGSEPAAGDVRKEDGSPEEMSQEEMTGLMDDVYAGGQRLARVGECVLMASEDGMKALFRGRMPQGTTFKEVIELLEESGIRFGVIQSRIYDVLPQKQSRRRGERGRGRGERGRGAAAEGIPEVVVAEGQASVQPPNARVEYHFREEGEAIGVKQILEGYDYGKIRDCRVSLTLVGPGQVLAEVIAAEGESGTDVFGEEIPPERPRGAELSVGENVGLEEGGQRCAATVYGYAGVVEGKVTVIEPVWVAQDLMRVNFVFLPQEGDFPAPTVGQVKGLLEQNGVVHGIAEKEIAGLCQRLTKQGKVERATLIARGTEATPGTDAAWRFVCNPELTQYFGQIVRDFNRSANAKALEEDLKGLAAKAVSAGEQLAIKLPPESGKIGTDVFGEEFTPDEPGDALLEEGENIRLAEDGQSCCAEIFGYIGIGKQGNRVQIISPIWVARERMAAYFVNLPQLGQKRAPTAEEIDRLLEMAGVRHGIDQQGVGLLCEKMKQGLPTGIAVPVARGAPVREGEDGRFEFAVDREVKPGAFAEDGSIDFRQLNLAPLVGEGERIGTRIEATQGTSGTDVTGRELRARDGEELIVEPSKSVRLVRQQGKPDAYHAEIEGELVVIERMEGLSPVVHLEVHPVMRVEGDVDFHTGHIEFPGSVHVEGSILSGFEVKAEGNVVVGDGVEEGGRVTAGGNVAVKHGIVGEKTRVSAEGSVFAKYITEAEVRARGDMNISEYTFNASLRADGEIAIWGTTGKRPSGVIAGGAAVAGERISAFQIGTNAAERTRLVAGVDARLLKQAADLQARIDQYQAVIDKTLRALQVEKVSPEQIRNRLLNLVLRAKGERKKMLARAVKNLLGLQERLGEGLGQKKGLEQQMATKAAKGAVEVSGTVAVNTLIRIGEHSLKIDGGSAAVTHTRFALGEDKRGKMRLLMTAS